MRRMRDFIRKLRLLLILPGVDWSDEVFRKDFARWKEILHIAASDRSALAEILSAKPEFRSLFIYRNSHRPVYRRWVALWYRPMDTIYIESAEIGGGLYIQHGFAKMITAKSIGESCWINQQVTIGYKDNTVPPVIGNNVVIGYGAKMLEQISVRDGTVIGANAVVIWDVEPGAVMDGVSAKRIR